MPNSFGFAGHSRIYLTITLKFCNFAFVNFGNGCCVFIIPATKK